MYQVLARKWRPRTFEEVIGQKHVVLALENSLKQNRLHQAYLFSGTRGVGKTTLARIFARCLNCETGLTATPCGECGVCQQISEGRFTDLIEVDAASRTGVDDMRELLENVRYKPVQGRYKIYLIDEVHMLSLSSFNALLKTLEEPPEHIMFLFATTHPKKIPVTVLSRCLQFNLTRLTHKEITGYLTQLLKAENIKYETDAVGEIAVGADGSVRDGLSLLDQAIAHGGGRLQAGEVKSMLGIVGRDEIGGLLQCVVDNQAGRLLEMVDELHAKAADFVGLTKDIMTFLHEIAILQAVPQSEVDPQFDADAVTQLSQKTAPEDIQLFYQIALQGMRDIPILPGAKNAFEMMMLRMLSFRPLTAGHLSSQSAPSVRNETKDTAASVATTPPPSPARSSVRPSAQKKNQTPVVPDSPDTVSDEPSAAAGSPVSPVSSARPPVSQNEASQNDLRIYQNPDQWPDLIGRLSVMGMEKELCDHSIMQVDADDAVTLLLDKEYEYLQDTVDSSELSEKFARFAGRAIRLTIQLSSGESETPSQKDARLRAEAKDKANQTVKNNPLVRQLQSEFDAHIVDDSVRASD